MPRWAFDLALDCLTRRGISLPLVNHIGLRWQNNFKSASESLSENDVCFREAMVIAGNLMYFNLKNSNKSTALRSDTSRYRKSFYGVHPVNSKSIPNYHIHIHLQESSKGRIVLKEGTKEHDITGQA
uniref:Transposase n=1 Tax=Steinernema glaseri TaxID=37863 RepID=A0A1I7YW86_9BILA